MAQKTQTPKATAVVVATGKRIEVYQHVKRETWIDSTDCFTEYKADELINLIIINPNGNT